MFIPIVIQTKWYQIPLRKSIPMALLLTASGTSGTYILFFVENHWLGGTSFYGAVFFVPVFFFLAAKILRESWLDLLDICAPAECVMLMIMKVQCLLSGCCAGRTLCLPWNQNWVQFPSQIAEMVNGFVIFLVLMWLARRGKNRGSLYGWYMVLYGSTRFVLNFFRENQSEFAMGLPAGAFWSVWAILFGSIALYLYTRNRNHI